jgi:hypothetical protein
MIPRRTSPSTKDLGETPQRCGARCQKLTSIKLTLDTTPLERIGGNNRRRQARIASSSFEILVEQEREPYAGRKKLTALWRR